MQPHQNDEFGQDAAIQSRPSGSERQQTSNLSGWDRSRSELCTMDVHLASADDFHIGQNESSIIKAQNIRSA